jgi:hypothetical protein
MDDELEVSKQSYMTEFESLRPDLYFPEEWTAEERAQASELVGPGKVRHMMLANIPMTCTGSRCIYASTCPYVEQNIAPVGKLCPIELKLVKDFAEDYVRSWGVNPNSLAEMSPVRTMVDQEVQFMRKERILANEHFIQENPVGVDAEGRVVTRKELHAAVQYEDAILRRQEKLRNAFLATKEARAKAGQGILDQAQSISNLMDSLREAEAEKNKLLLQALGLDKRDAYIEGEVISEDNDELPDLDDL